MNILFICKYNRFRSRIAEAYFNKIGNSDGKARSAGIVPGIPITEDILKISRKYGLDIKGIPIGLTHQLLQWSDVIIIISDNISKDLFSEEIINDRKKIIKWDLKDAKTPADRPGLIEAIKRKVDDLVIEIK